MDSDNVKRVHTGPSSWFKWLKDAVSGNRVSSADEFGLRWHLDTPSNERPVKVEAAGVVVQGWVLLPPSLAHHQSDVQVVAHWGGVFELTHPLVIERPDVIQRVCDTSPQTHSQLRCGFRFTVPRLFQAVDLSLLLDGERLHLEHISLKASTDPAPGSLLSHKVLEGKEGWLFLDNDTNGSVDQYRGNMRLTPQGLYDWQKYLQGFATLARQHQATPGFLIAPSKESVMGARYHPLEEGVGGPIHQLLELPEADVFSYPVDELKSLGDEAFIQTDTHWSPKGAMTAGLALFKALGLDMAQVERVFAEDDYQARTMSGDLGKKFSPPRECQTQIMCSFGYHRYRHFDNGLPNFGRLIVIHYDDALTADTCLVFGSSSSYFLLNYLGRLFVNVVFVHSAGNLDPALIAAVKPQYLVVQTNARFVVQVPKENQSLSELVEEKRARLTPEEHIQLEKRRVTAAENDVLIQTLGLSPWVAL